MIDVLRAQLASLRTQIGSLQAQCVALEETLDAMSATPAPVACTHASVTNEGTFGAPYYVCDTCHQHVPDLDDEDPAA